MSAKRKISVKPNRSQTRGFMMLELLGVVILLTLLATLVAIPYSRFRFLEASIANEDRVLNEINRDVMDSFKAESMEVNISAVPGEVAPGDPLTEFSPSNNPIYPAVNGREWFSKLARFRGHSVSVGSAVDKISSPALYALTHNESGRQRLLFAGPTEGDMQRYIIVSLIDPNNELTLPPYSPTADWFNSFWDIADRADMPIPSLWNSLLSPQQLASWVNEGGGSTKMRRLRVVKITQRKYVQMINSNHPTNYAYVSWNGGAKKVTLLPKSGLNVIGPVLYGRTLDIAVGPDEATLVHSGLKVYDVNNYVAQ